MIHNDLISKNVHELAYIQGRCKIDDKSGEIKAIMGKGSAKYPSVKIKSIK